MIYRILGGIYLSSIEPINNEVDLKKQYNITHILSILPGPIPSDYQHNYIHRQIEVTDEETTNLIQYFKETNEFLDSVLCSKDVINEKDNKKHNGCVLVHCAQGVSRSVTVVMAYLMYRHNLNYDQALHAVKRKNNSAEPNPGFIEQLKLYHSIKFDVDPSNQVYKQFLINLSLKSDPSGESLKQLNLFSLKKKETESRSINNDYNLRCKKCRQILAIGEQIEYHDPPAAASRQAQFIKTAPNSRRIISVKEAASNCSHYFLKEPLNWMRSELEDKGEIEGKFQCPKCASKVGGYSWKGSRCSCGKWMIPAIHLQTAKVDNIRNILHKFENSNSNK